MLRKIDTSILGGRKPIKILYPGLVGSNRDTGIGSIGRIDYAYMEGAHSVPMHPHVNDEILTYVKSGKGEHRDSMGNVEIIGKNKLMLMKAGVFFAHEERMIDEGEPLEALQIFIRPGKKDLDPQVIFYDVDQSMYVSSKWRLLASPSEETTFQFSSQTWIYDMKLMTDDVLRLPELPKDNLTCLLYVFSGTVIINSGDLKLGKKESLIIRDENIIIETDSDAELVLFVTDENAEYFDEGMYSGNKMK